MGRRKEGHYCFIGSQGPISWEVGEPLGISERRWIEQGGNVRRKQCRIENREKVQRQKLVSNEFGSQATEATLISFQRSTFLQTSVVCDQMNFQFSPNGIVLFIWFPMHFLPLIVVVPRDWRSKYTNSLLTILFSASRRAAFPFLFLPSSSTFAVFDKDFSPYQSCFLGWNCEEESVPKSKRLNIGYWNKCPTRKKGKEVEMRAGKCERGLKPGNERGAFFKNHWHHLMLCSTQKISVPRFRKSRFQMMFSMFQSVPFPRLRRGCPWNYG